MNRVLAEVLAGLPLGADAQSALSAASGWLRSYRELVETALDLLDARKSGEEGFVVGGTTNILRQPEFRDVEKAEALFSAIEEEAKLRRVLGEPPDEGRVRVAIGREIAVREMQDCSIVTAAYRRRGTWGQVAVVGPKRMDYAEVVGLVQAVALALSAAFDGVGDAFPRR